MRRLEHRHADAVVADQRGQAGERLVKLVRIPERTFKKPELLARRTAGRGDELQADDGMLGGEAFQMRVQHAKKHLHVAGRGGDFEGARTAAAIRQIEPQRELRSHAIDRLQAQGELLEETAQQEKQRLERFDRVLKFHALLKRIHRREAAQRTLRSGRWHGRKAAGLPRPSRSTRAARLSSTKAPSVRIPHFFKIPSSAAEGLRRSIGRSAELLGVLDFPPALRTLRGEQREVGSRRKAEARIEVQLRQPRPERFGKRARGRERSCL